jgi:hypothetical protein
LPARSAPRSGTCSARTSPPIPAGPRAPPGRLTTLV